MLDPVAAMDEDARSTVEHFGDVLRAEPAQLGPIEHRDRSGQHVGRFGCARARHHDRVPLGRGGLGEGKGEGKGGGEHGQTYVVRSDHPDLDRFAGPISPPGPALTHA